ncbi:heme ABC transporter permease [Candidatus Spongiihabitans sp.]|uniref:heme ABC transporter permease n=1 Tax=Candidatus Spongiihabitans sp. TaxID=3101308 RepID=UPI003C6F0913
MQNPDIHARSPNKSWLWLHRFGSPVYFYGFAQRWATRCGVTALLLFVIGLYYGLIVAPVDYQMGDSYRIIFIHAPSAWMSMFTYVVMAVAAATGLIWGIKLGHAVARACAPLGAVFTFCALVTGAIWGKPTWGAYWIWDARLTSELVLLFLYFGYMALISAIEDKRTASRAAALLAVVGLVNIPIIHYSVEWWNTLHQGSTVTRLARPAMDIEMLIPLLIMFAAINFYFIASLFNRVRCELLDQERQTQWVKNLVHKHQMNGQAHG